MSIPQRTVHLRVPNHSNTSSTAGHDGLLFLLGNVHQTQVRNMKYVFCLFVFFFTFILCFTGGECQSLLTLFCTFSPVFLCCICKHSVKMYILGSYSFMSIGMLYHTLSFKLNVLYFFNCLVVIAQQNVSVQIKHMFVLTVLVLITS